MEKDIVRFLKEYLGEVEDRWRLRLKKEYPQLFVAGLQEELTDRLLKKLVTILEKYLIDSDLNVFLKRYEELDKTTSQLIPFIESFEWSTYDLLVEKEVKSDAELFSILHRTANLKQKIYSVLIQSDEKKYKKIIEQQRTILQERSTPIIPILDGVIVVPVIGAIDTERSKQMMESILNAVVSNQSEIVLIDITGVSVVDTSVALHLIELTNAIHIVGASSMLVGIRPDIAQVLVKLGIDLSSIVTLGTLQEGIEKALQSTNRYISEVDDS